MKKNNFLSFLFIVLCTLPILTSCGGDDDPFVEPTKSDAELLTKSYTKVNNNIVGTWLEEAYVSFLTWKHTSSDVERWTFNSDGTAYEEIVADVATNKIIFTCHWRYSVIKDTSRDMKICTQNRTAWNGKNSAMYYPYSTGAVVLKLTCLDYKDSDKEYFVEIKDNGKMYIYDTYKSVQLGDYTFGKVYQEFTKK